MSSIVDLPEPEYPKLGEPLLTSVMRPSGKVELLYLGHIETSQTTGKFIDLAFDSESICLEYAANYLADLRNNWRVLGKI